jgi:4a-hydroxytetrahydrobiopterin dehydratase
MTILSSDMLQSRLTGLKGWEIKDGLLTKKFTLKDFKAAIAFVVQLAFYAEVADHHPDIAIAYNAVTISLSTHSEGGITEKDFSLAEQIEKVFRG